MAASQQQVSAWQSKITALRTTQAESEKELQGTLNSLRKQVEQVTAKNAQMKHVLAVDNKDATLAQQERIDKLYELIDTYKRKMEVQGRSVQALQHDLELTQVKLQDMQRLTGGAAAAAESAKQAARARQLLENRLEQAEKRFGEALAVNKALHQEIDQHNKEREAFRQMCARLERELAEMTEELQVVQSSTDICDEAYQLTVKQITALQVQNDKEAAAAQKELQEISACQEADKALLQVQADRLASATSTLDLQGGPPQAHELDVLACEAVVAALQDACGIKSLPKLVGHMSQLEALTFRLFNECNEANSRVEHMQKELNSLRMETQQLDEASGTARQKEVIKSTHAKEEQARQRAESLHSKKVALERRLALVRAGVGAALKCLAGHLMLAAKPEDPDCVYATLLQNLGQLEARSRALVAVHSTLSGRNNAGAQAMLSAHLSTSAGSGHGSAALQVAATQAVNTVTPAAGPAALVRPMIHKQPSLTLAKPRIGATNITCETHADEADSSDDDSDDGIPLTRQQLQARLGYAL